MSTSVPTQPHAASSALKSGASPSALRERMKIKLNYDELTNCMRCGFCQPACPTFQETGYEAASPRGRIALMKAVTDGLMEPDASFRQQMDLCLGCRACEPVCPADVKYGQLLEQTRAVLEEQPEHRWWVRIARQAAFKHVFPSPKRMRLVGGALKVYQRSGLRALAQASVLKLFPDSMRQMEAILPPAASQGVIEQLGSFYPAKGEAIATVGMFRGCIMDILFTNTNINTVKLLSEAGFNVVIPEAQQCCGALHAHSGELEQAKQLAKQNIAAFKQAKVDYIVSNAGGCGALLIEYDHLLHEDAEWSLNAQWFAERVKDVSQIVMEQGRLAALFPPSGQASAKNASSAGGTSSPKLKVTYQDSCHLRNVMKSGNAPRDLISRTADITFVELPEADRCCGSAGIYNLVQPEMSMQILDHKMEHVKHTEAHVLLTSNPGCLLQMKLGAERENMSDRLKVMHVVDFLHERLQTSTVK